MHSISCDMGTSDQPVTNAKSRVYLTAHTYGYQTNYKCLNAWYN